MKRATSENEHLTAAIDRMRAIPQDATAICADGEFLFRSELVKLGSGTLDKLIKSKTVPISISLPDKTIKIAKGVFDYIQFGDIPDNTELIRTLVEIYSMAEEYGITGLCAAIKARFELCVKHNCLDIYASAMNPSLVEIRNKAYVVLRDYIRQAFCFACNICQRSWEYIPCKHDNDKCPRADCLISARLLYHNRHCNCMRCGITGAATMEANTHVDKEGKSCPGKIQIKHYILNIEGLSDVVLLELFKRIAGDHGC